MKLKTLLLSALLASTGSAAQADVVWYDGTAPVTYCVDSPVAPVVTTALNMFADDMRLVTGQPARAAKTATIHLVQLDRATPATLRQLRALGLPVDEVAPQFDAFSLTALPAGVYLLGSNGRGCAYGLLELSRMAGVSPWVWWGDVRPDTRSRLALPDDFSTVQAPSVQYRGIFINDEDWTLRRWSSETFEPTGRVGIGPKTYREIFRLLLRLRANTIWPAMHEGGTGFFTVRGRGADGRMQSLNKLMADSCGILIGTSHCEPLLRNNVAEWDVQQRGDYNYITNRDEVRRYWTERLQEVRGSEELFTIGMRGIHDGAMAGVKTREEKLNGLQQVIDDQRELLRKYYLPKSAKPAAIEQVPQVFIPYKEVLEIMESGLRVPDDVTLMWCDDNYGYLTRLPDAAQQQRRGGGGVYYHLSYWGRPHDHLWLTTTQPGLIYSEMKTAYDHNCRRLWIANVHDPKVAAYDLELFLDMAWNINAITPAPASPAPGVLTLQQHLERWLVTQFGPEVGHAVAPAMARLYRLNGIRRPEFMGWTQVELNKKVYPGGKSVPSATDFTLSEACQRMADFAQIEALVDVYARMVPVGRQDAYFAHVLYPVHAAAAMTRKMLAQPEQSQQAYRQIQQLTEQYNTMGGGKWRGLMSASPRNLPVFSEGVRTELAPTVADGPFVARNACQYDGVTEVGGHVFTVEMLGHSMRAVVLPKGSTLTYTFSVAQDGDALLRTAMIPTQPSDRGDLRYAVQIDDQPAVTISLKEPYRSERWKQSVLRGQSLRSTPVRLAAGSHRLRITALDDHIIADQWMVDFCPDRRFYVIPTD